MSRPYLLKYYEADGTVEMFDLKNRRTFLKRMVCEGISLKDLFIGSVVTVYARQLKIVDYADKRTATALGSKMERTFAMIKPDAYEKTGKILALIQANGFSIANLKQCKLSLADAQAFYAVHKAQPFYNDLCKFMSSDVVTALELVGNGAIQGWRKLLGPTSSFTARSEAPNSIRGLFGTDNTKNAAHGSDSSENAQIEIGFFFGPGSKLTSRATYDNCSLCVIKPHAIIDGNAGKIIDDILEDGFEISALQMFHLNRAMAEEFLEVYKGVLPEYNAMVEHLLTGPVMALEVRAENCATAFRELAGPSDPEIARALRPQTLRAKYGADKVKNAVHCTDLPEDGVLEVEYFFKILNAAAN